MTQQEIEALALQYHGIECVKVDKFTNKHTESGLFKPVEVFYLEVNDHIEYIELRSIESLTDEEAKELGYNNKKGIINFEDCLMQIESDYLRSIGVAVPFRGYSVEQIIEQGILKLKNHE